MTQPRMETIEDLVSFLKTQHDQLKELLPRVLDAAGDKRQQLFDEVRRTLAVHEALEQETVHLAAAELAGGASARMEEESNAEHAIGSLEGAEPDSDEFTDGFGKLQADVVDHAEHEEGEEFPKLSGELTEVAKARVAEGLRLFGEVDDGSLAGDTFADMFTGAKRRINEAS